MHRKFTNEEFYKLYLNGLSDNKISKRFGVNVSSVCRRRIKMGLVAQNPIYYFDEKDLEGSVENNRDWHNKWCKKNSDKVHRWNSKAWELHKKGIKPKEYWLPEQNNIRNRKAYYNNIEKYREWSRESYNRRNPIRTLNCKECNVEIITRDNRTIFCSKKCKWRCHGKLRPPRSRR